MPGKIRQAEARGRGEFGRASFRTSKSFKKSKRTKSSQSPEFFNSQVQKKEWIQCYEPHIEILQLESFGNFLLLCSWPPCGRPSHTQFPVTRDRPSWHARRATTIRPN